MKTLIIAVALLGAFPVFAGEPPALHPIFRDGMVFAAGKSMRIYGSGKGPVKVTFRGGTYAAEDAADGWRVTLPPASPAGAETLTVDLDGRRTVLKDVRLGEVFLAAGQSNWRVMFSESTTDRTGWTDEPRLRCYTASSLEGLPFSPKDGWVPFTVGKAPEWSALITLFGRERLAAGAAAFGAVGCYQGASVIESWNSPGKLYNEVFRKIGPFAFSGVVWYQGESNTGPGEAAVYAKWLGELVKTWRRDLEDPELKFMIVQIADLDWRNDADWHALQAAQVEAADAIADAVAVRSSDVCESANVHPREKSALARRLSRTWDAIQTRGNLDLSYDVANPGGLKSFTVARRTMNRDFTVCGVRYRFPGEIDWKHNPTYNNYCEWPWQFARHYFLPDLAEYYRVTEDPEALSCFTNLVGCFIDRAPPPAAGTSPYDTKSWRTLDTGLRVSMWMASWPAFAKAPGMTDAFRRKFVRSLKDHIVRLRPCRTYNNWRVMELSGLVEIVLMFPELDPDGAILRGAEDEYRNILATQLHPDGFSFELSPGYHGILPKVFSALAERYRKAGRTPPEDLEKGLELAYELYPHIVRPDRRTPDVNDSGSGSIVPAMKTAARLFPDRADFRWFATDGREGRAPDYLSYAFPNAGAVVFRDGWTTNAVWGYVDMGPYGYAHQHEDKLNFLLFAYGKEMLTEGGIYDYDTSEMRKYVLSTRGHNTVRIDGHDQFAGKTEGHWRYMTKDASGKPIVNKAVLAAKADLTFTTTPARDFAEATFAHGYNAGGRRDESVTHTRAVEFVKDGGAPYFRVTDTLKARDEREHSYEQLWHLETCELKLGEKSFVADFGDGVSLEATFASANGRLVDLRGRKTPEYQGWLPIRPCGDHEHRPIHTPALRGTFRGSAKIVVEFRPEAAGAVGGGPRMRDLVSWSDPVTVPCEITSDGLHVRRTQREPAP